MSEETITLKFDDADPRTQRELQRQLNELCRRLVVEGEVLYARVQTVFPGDPDPAMASMFTIDLAPAQIGGLDAALRLMRGLPGVEYAQTAAPRRATQPAQVRQARH